MHLSKEHGRLPTEKGGLAAQDVGAIKTTSAIGWVARMEKHPNLAWVQLAVTLCRDTRSTRTRVEKVLAP